MHMSKLFSSFSRYIIRNKNIFINTTLQGGRVESQGGVNMVQSINNQNQIPTKSIGNNDEHIHQSKTRSESGINNNMDTVTITQNQEAAQIYSNTLSATETADKGYEMLRRLVTSMLKEQGIDYEIAVSDSSSIDISELSQEEAQELVADDGYFGVEQTSDRIVDFALSLAGDDVSRLDAIKEGVENGFNEALEAFGGTLPDISYKTFDTVMQKLDAWAAEAQSNAV